MILLIIALFLIIILRLAYVFLNLGSGEHKENVSILAVAGSGNIKAHYITSQTTYTDAFESGGHTTELLRLMKTLTKQYRPRHYVVANTDHMSESKIKEAEMFLGGNINKEYFITKIPRSREVAQPWLSSAYTSLVAIFYSIPLVWKVLPDVIICNGPGTCIPICAIAMLFKVIGIKRIHIIFVESMCRVNSLSMTGEILYHLADKVFVQWPQLKEKYPKSVYYGRIV